MKERSLLSRNNKYSLDHLSYIVHNLYFFIFIFIGLALSICSIEILNDEMVNISSSGTVVTTLDLYALAFGSSVLEANPYIIVLLFSTLLGVICFIIFALWSIFTFFDHPMKYLLLVVSFVSFVTSFCISMCLNYIITSSLNALGAGQEVYFLWPFIIYVTSICVVIIATIYLIIQCAIKSFSKK